MIDSAMLTIWGNVVAEPRVTGLADNPDRVAFRIVSNRRRRDPQSGDWVDASEFGINVVCWRKIARGVAQSVHRGDPVLVIGKISNRTFTGSDGQQRWLSELTADFVGLDLSQGISGRFTRFTHLDRLTIRDGGLEAGVGGATSLDDGASQVPGQGDGEVGDAEASENDGAVADFGSEIDFEAAGEAALDAEPEPAVF